MKILIQTTKKQITNFLVNFTLAKLLGALFTIIIVSLIKYCISGNLHIDYSEFGNNVGIGLLGWTINTGAIGLLTEYLNIKGINFNLNQFLYGTKDIMAGSCSADGNSSKFKPKLYCAMDIDDESDPSRGIDKGKGIDRGNTESVNEEQSEAKPFDKGKGIDRTVHPIPVQPVEPTEPHMVTWSRVFPGIDPASIIFPKTINPGAGFNVPGGDVPLRDDICKHIDYNSHILKQFRTMDLKTAIEQRDNYLRYIEIINHKTTYAQGVLSKQPPVPTNDYQFRLRKQIISDLENLNAQKVRAEGKATLLNSRIEFIEIHRKRDE